MKHNIHYILYSLLLLLIPLAVTSCEDDLVFGPNGFPEGEAVISAEVTFKPLVSALGSRAVSGGTPGDAIKSINQLWVVVFDSKGKLSGEKKGYGSGIYLIDKSDITESENSAMPDDALPSPTPDPATGQHQAEEKTVKASFKLPVSLPYGNYRMYAVANVDLSKYWKAISTSDNPAETLKNIQLTWNSEKVAENNQMFGYFTTYNETDNGKSKGFDAPLVTIASKTVSLRAWLKRAASKVTIAFDARKLKENIYIYLKSVEIKDIPATCWLGKENPGNSGSPEDKGSKIDYATFNKSTQVITYHEAEGNIYTPETWPEFLSSGHPVYGAAPNIINENPSMSYDDLIKKQHGEDVTALYFYENMQGKGVEGTMSDKRQQVNQSDRDKHETSFPDGVHSDNEAWKDAKPYGTYIEVKAYYFSNNTGDPGQGEITYRFMLGKDTHLDYNAERNHHYKLTMKFNGYANDVDFHIDYEDEDRPLDVPNPYFISYLYNHSMMLPLSFDTGEATVTSIKAEIIDNNWAPLNATDGWTNNSTPANDVYALYWGVGDVLNGRPYNGFLSLRKTNDIVVTGSMPFQKNSNENYYTRTERGVIEYTNVQPTPDKTIEQALEAGTLHVMKSEEKGNNHYTVHMPLWTRAKQLIKQTAYTGNNPYIAYQREAKIKVTVRLSDGRELTSGLSNNDGEISGELISIRQVRRIVNPKGIYRKGGKKPDPFRVVLKILPNEESTSFMSLISQGPWRAYVMRDTKRPKNGKDSEGTICLTGNSETTTTGKITINDRDPNTPPETYETLEGKTGSFIDFNVIFNGTTSDDNPNYAVIRVEYNNYTCYHLIFVRQGYGADALLDNGAKWMTCNNVSQSEFANNPLDEGSLFKFGNWIGIKASNNKNNRSPWTRITPNDFKANKAPEKLEWTDGSQNAWNYQSGTSTVSTGVSFGDSPDGYRIAKLEDYMALYHSDDIEQGYGVLYGDGSQTTLDNIEDVYGYMHSDNNPDRGMRGCFVYNYKTGKNLFFPIGASGYGHRMNSLSRVGNNTGVLRYSCSRWRIGYFPTGDIYSGSNLAYEGGINAAPLFFDLFRRPGGIYWVGETTTDPLEPGTLVGWDINYFTFDFFPISSNNVQDGADACFIRSIKEEL